MICSGKLEMDIIFDNFQSEIIALIDNFHCTVVGLDLNADGDNISYLNRRYLFVCV
jgi:hypothetical protein